MKAEIKPPFATDGILASHSPNQSNFNEFLEPLD